MAQAPTRRPLPALAFLLGLTLLTALVWWRVIHRADGSSHKAASTPTCAAPSTPTTVPQPGAVTVSVLNGTEISASPRNGLAGEVSSTLHGLGFKVGTVGNDTSTSVAGVAEIRYVPAGAGAAKLVSFYLPGARLVPTTRADLTASLVEVSVGATFTKVATAAQAKAAMLAAHVTQAPAAPASPGRLAVGPTGKATGSHSASSRPTC